MSKPRDRFFFLDVETTGLPRAGSHGITTFEEFFAASGKGSDYRQSSFFRTHARSQLLQVYAEGLPVHQPRTGWKGFDNEYAHTFIRPQSGYSTKRGFVPFEVSDFSRVTGGYARASKYGRLSEPAAVRAFYWSLSREMAQGPVSVGGWNVLYDLSALEAATWRHDSLSRYRGFFGREVEAGRLQIESLEAPFLETAAAFSAEDASFRDSFLRMKPNGRVARSVEDLRKVPGWSVESVARAVQPDVAAHFHDAVRDIGVERELYSTFRNATRAIQGGASVEEALRHSGIIGRETTARQFFESAYSTPWLKGLEEEAAAGAAIAQKLDKVPSLTRKPLVALGVAAGLAAASALAFGKRRDRQTQITGLSDDGIAAVGRHRDTDFGSGWTGDKKRHTLRTAAALTAGAIGLRLFKQSIAKYGGGAVHKFIDTVERRSPIRMLGTFRASELASSYIPRELIFESSHLMANGRLTSTGEHIERALGRKVSGERMVFERTKATDPYLTLAGSGERLRFAMQGERTGASFRLDKPLAPVRPQAPVAASSWTEKLRNWGEARQHAQRPHGNRSMGGKVEGYDKLWQPLWRDKRQAARVIGLNVFEGPQKVLSSIGLGLPRGSYNKSFHFPFAGEGGLVNEMLVKRVLPAYAAWTAVRYVDYKLDHKPRDTAASIPLRANVLRAELTDNLPFARKITDWYSNHVPGPQYGPLALPAAGVFLAGLSHYSKVVQGAFDTATHAVRKQAFHTAAKQGAKVGGLLMLPFLPGMLGSRKTAGELRRIYSGEEPVPVRTGRWWEVGSTPFGGNKIKYFRPHWFARMRSGAEMRSTYGSEENYWAHHPLLHPIRSLREPYWLESLHYHDRPYPIASPAFSNVPLVGPLLAATVGRLAKPPIRMHAEDWDGSKYQLFGPKAEPRGDEALPPSFPKEEFTLRDAARRELEMFDEFIGLPGFIEKSVRQRLKGEGANQKEVFFEGSRKMTSTSRRYYEQDLGAGFFLTPEGESYGYTEGIRRFIQREPDDLQANEIPNELAGVSWLPDKDYIFDLKTGDPYAKIQEGYMRLPGSGYEALNPDVEGLAAKDYPDWHKFKILADVAPYSTRFFQFSAIVKRQIDAEGDTEKQIEYERVMERVQQIKDTSLNVARRRFSEDVDVLQGTVEEASAGGVSLAEYPGQRFTFSSVGTSAADLSSVVLGEQNRLTKSAVARSVEDRMEARDAVIAGMLAQGTRVRLTVPKGAGEHATEAAAVIETDEGNVNRALIDQGLGLDRMRDAGPEAQAMTGALGNLIGRYAEAASFTGDNSALNPLRYIPTPYHSKLWQERTALEQYRNEEVYGSRRRRWQNPSDFVGPYTRGTGYRLTGRAVVPEQVQQSRDLNTMGDQLEYLRALNNAASDPAQKGRFKQKAARTNVGADLVTASDEWAQQTLARRERYYFQHFVAETDPEKRGAILATASPELARALSAKWVGADVAIAKSRGTDPGGVTQQGRVVTEAGLNAYESADTELGYGDYIRSQEVAEFFHRKRLHLPEPGDRILADDIDMEDVKLRVVQNEGWDYHDFNIFKDRASMLWRKPFLDGAVRELTTGGSGSVENLRRSVEQLMLAANTDASVTVSAGAARVDRTHVSMTIDQRPDRAILRDVRRNREEYQ